MGVARVLRARPVWAPTVGAARVDLARHVDVAQGAVVALTVPVAQTADAVQDLGVVGVVVAV